MSDYFEPVEDFDEEEPKSKSAIKREMHELQDLGKRLLQLRKDQLSKIPMSVYLQKAVEESTRITQHEAQRRHLQYIGKLMRDEDADAIRHAVDLFDASSKVFAQQLHVLEKWRDRLVSGDNDVIAEYIEKHPVSDIQHFRQLVRNAKKDAANEKNTGASRKLFKFLKEIQEQQI
ncbi:MAG: DUF615 domain-containing protein [Hahellaceae bacterium]|nr:DUF615 domain-containing protein [Hahellaceae bacterium]MCP5169030.1 DUF615 domain-containing protein [Hahellaceae bacterium]